MSNKPQLTMLAAMITLPGFSIANAGATSIGPGEQLNPHQVAVETLKIYFGESNEKSFAAFAENISMPTKFNKPAGVFVTLSRNGKTRACWGSIYPQHENVGKATVYSTLGALTKDYRFPPIKRSQWKKLHVQVTIIDSVVPISGIHELNPLRDGLMVRSSGKSGVLLPGEAIDAHYQLVACKLKAGIRPKEPCQLYKLRTEIYD